MNQLSHWLRSERACTAILMRHAERGHFNHPAEGASVPSTPQGAIDAEVLGRSLAQFGILHVSHSPVGRRRQTAEALGWGPWSLAARSMWWVRRTASADRKCETSRRHSTGPANSGICSCGSGLTATSARRF